MATLRRTDGATWHLPTRVLLGRSRACTIRLDDPAVSGEHALMRWTGCRWELQDLHSRNGTFIAGARLEAGQRRPLAAGAVVGLGRLDGLVLVDAGPPQAHALRLDAEGEALAAEDGLLTLPDPADPELTIYAHGPGWRLDGHDDVRAVVDGEIVETRGGRWRLQLPEHLARTLGTGDEGLALSGLALRFAVSHDEEHIEVSAVHGERRIDLRARAHHTMLLHLARLRLGDRHRPVDQQGWIHQDDLIHQLGCTAEHLYLVIHRLRRQIAKAGISDAADIVERREGTRRLRIGVADLTIEPLDPP